MRIAFFKGNVMEGMPAIYRELDHSRLLSDFIEVILSAKGYSVDALVSLKGLENASDLRSAVDLLPLGNSLALPQKYWEQLV